KNMKWSNSVSFTIGDARATTTITDGLGGTKIITSEGDDSNRIKKNQVVYQISADGVSFFFGAQVGDGGIRLDDNATINGNVFSNGSIGASNGIITGTVKVAKKENMIDGLNVSGDAYVDICINSNIFGILYASTSINCTASQFIPSPVEIATTSLPISQAQITEWENEAATGGTYVGDYILNGGTTYLGPKKIQGNLTVQNNAKLFLTGKVWVTGSVNITNNAIVQLDKNTYHSLSGIIISDGLITLANNSVSSGSGDAGSYLMYLSISALNPAIIIQNNAIVDILYTSNGWIEVSNNAQLREITGYGIYLKNNSRITYEIGLIDTSFLSGSGGGWKVTSWKEIE
ncbi:MAG: hypothetical protein Q7S82_00170, partial [bacterium]|nr:hypothetical protein [bacterium]